MRRSSALVGVYRYSAEPQRLAAWYAEHLDIDASGNTPGEPLQILPADSKWQGGTSAVSISVPRLDDTVEALRGQGIEVDGPHHDAGGDCATLSDPDGNPVLLRQASSSAAQGQPYIYLLDSEEPEQGESAEEPRKKRHRLPKSVPIALALVVALAVVFAYVVDPADGSSDHAAPDTTPSDATVRTTTVTAPSNEHGAITTTVRDIRLGQSMLGIHGDWQILAQGSDEVVRIQPADGRITRITISSLEVSGPVSLIAWPNRTYVRSMGGASSYIVHDDGSTTEHSGKLVPGFVYPGLEPGQLWAPVARNGGSGSTTYRLVKATGEPVSPDVLATPVGSWPIGSDSNGHLLVNVGGDVFLAKRDATKRVTTGTMLAAGPTKFLVLECDRNAHGYKGDLALSPNGRWLFHASSDGTLSAVDTDSLRVHEITADLPPIQELTIRAQ